MTIQRSTQRQLSIILVGSVLCTLALGGCRAPSPAQNAENVAPATGNSVKPVATKAPAKGAPAKGTPAKSAPPVTVKNKKPEKVAAKPTPTPTMTVTQAMGVGILKAINGDPGMAGHKISVGTGPGTVWLDGSVAKAAQKVLAEKIAKSKAPQAKVVNHLNVGAPIKASSKAPVPAAKPTDKKSKSP